MQVSLGPYRLEFATEFGPRITSLRWNDGPELLARLGPETAIDHRGGTYRFHGGHRLWAAPEVPGITYAPDDHECRITQDDDGYELTAPPDAAGVRKELRVSLGDEGLVVDHRIEWSGGLALAPWAITQFPLGGTAILPVLGEETAPLANRFLVLWPYTSLTDPRMTMAGDALVVEAQGGDALKLGSGPAPGRLGYLRDGHLFVKEVPAADNGVPDFGAVGQLYVGQGFCELESMGPVVDPSQSNHAHLKEVWRVTHCSDLATARQLVTAP
jgi:hypothetical protein